MHIILLVLGGLVSALIWYKRLQSARAAAVDVGTAVVDAKNAFRARRFRQRANTHPVDCIEDARLAAAGLIAGTLQLDYTWNEAAFERMVAVSQRVYGFERREAEEIVTFGKWASDQGQPHETIRRLIRRLNKLAGREALADTEAMLLEICGTDFENLEEIRTKLRRSLA